MLLRRIPRLVEIISRGRALSTCGAGAIPLLCASSSLLVSHTKQHLGTDYQSPHDVVLRSGGFSFSFAASYAKKDKGGKKGGGKKQEAVQESEADPPEFELEPFKELMEAGISHLQSQLGHIHSGKADPGLLEPLIVEAHAERLPLRTYGTVVARNPQLLVITCYNSEDMTPVAEAVSGPPLRLQARIEGKEVLVPIPKPTQEVIKRMLQLVSQEAHEALLSIQRARHKALEAAKKSFTSTDDYHRAEKQVKTLHDKMVSNVERIRAAKDADLRVNH